MDLQTLKKTNKPLTEKRRRERINKSLEQLKTLVLRGTNKETNVKLEKADIMDMTVRYIEDLQHKQHSEGRDTSQMVLNSYIQGYSTCINEVNNTLAGTHIITDDVKHNLSSYLTTSLYAFTTRYPPQEHSFTNSMFFNPDQTDTERVTSTPYTYSSFLADDRSRAQLSPIVHMQTQHTASPDWSSMCSSDYAASSPESLDSGVHSPPSASSVWRPW